MAKCKQRGPNLQRWNTPAHCPASEGLNQHPALTDIDIYKHPVEYAVVKGYSIFVGFFLSEFILLQHQYFPIDH